MKSHDVLDEFRAAVGEEVSRMLGSATERNVGEGASRCTSSVNSHSSDYTSSSSERAQSFEEFYRKREEERQHGFKPPREKMKRSHSNQSMGAGSQKSANVEIKVGLAAEKDEVIKFRRCRTRERRDRAEGSGETC